MAASQVTLETEHQLLSSGYSLVAGLDEVGTGSAAGPCYCALVVIDAATPPPPGGLDDSKRLTARKREALSPLVQNWAVDWSIGIATAGEIDELGLTLALRLAGLRALSNLRRVPDIVILDGKRDWLTQSDEPSFLAPGLGSPTPPVITMVKADRYCASVAAASVIAKVQRDAYMDELSLRYPEYEWSSNKGYLSAGHAKALAQLGQTPEHRASWNIPNRS